MKAFPYAPEDQNLFFVAEIGGNHNQDKKRLFDLIDSAKCAGFDAVKLQYYNPDKLWADGFEKEKEAARKMALPADLLVEAFYYCQGKGIALGCSVFDLEAVTAVSRHVDFLKIASYECMWFDLIQRCQWTGKPVFVSTGMCNPVEIIEIENFMYPKEEDAIFHCCALYPASIDNIDFDILMWLLQKLPYFENVGYSDHSCIPSVILSSVVFGANIIEMHIDLFDMQGNESKIANHCWCISETTRVINDAKYIKKITDPFELDVDRFIKINKREDRKNVHLRTDPTDGMRPMKYFREKGK